MKLLYVDAVVDRQTGGGIAERGVQLCRALTSAGTACTMLTLDIGLDAGRRGDLEGITVRALRCLNRRFWIPAVRTADIRQMVADADVIELCSHWTVLNALVYRAARALRKPYIVTPAGALGIAGRSPILKSLYNSVIGRRMIRNAAGPVAVTADEIPAFEAYGAEAGKVVVIPNGVNLQGRGQLDCGVFRRAHGLDHRRFVLFMGRLNFIKGPDLLLEAFAQTADSMPEYDLVFAGPDEGMLERLKALATKSGVSPRVHFLGYLGGLDWECAYRSCDLLAIPSRREAMSLVAVEAGIRGKPVLITDQCGFHEIESSGGGRVVEATVEGLAGGLRTLVSDAGRLPEMGRALQTYVRDRYTWERSAQIHQDLCRRILRRSQSAIRRRDGTKETDI